MMVTRRTRGRRMRSRRSRSRRRKMILNIRADIKVE